MREIIELIYNFFAGWFEPRSSYESYFIRIGRGLTGILLIILSISVVIIIIVLLAKLKNAT